MIFFYIIVLAVLAVFITYTALRGWQALRSHRLARNVYLWATLAWYACLFGAFFVPSTSPAAKPIAFIGFSALFFYFYLLLMFVVVDLVRTANYFLRFAPKGMIAFRKYALLASFAVISVLMIVGNRNFNRQAVVELNLNILNDKPVQNRELRIAALSDIHLGVSFDRNWLQRAVQLINEQNPDIVLMVGDLIDNTLAPLWAQSMYEEFWEINAPLGVFAVPGNHEYYGEGIDYVIEFFRRGNVLMLRDSVVLVDNSFYIVGRDDFMIRNRKPLDLLIYGIKHEKPIILLDHQPFNLKEAEKNGVDLQISGHTHNGQFFPINLITNRIFEVAHGHAVRGNTHYYVSSGLAIWGPQYRIGTQSEIVVINFSF